MLPARASLVLCKSTTQYNACLIVWRGHNSNPQQSTNISQRAYSQGRSCSVKPRSSILQRNDLLKKVLYNFIIFPLFLLSIFAKQGQTSSYTFCIWSFDSSCSWLVNDFLCSIMLRNNCSSILQVNFLFRFLLVA